MTAIDSLQVFLNKRILGQQEAVSDFASSIERAEHGPKRQGRVKSFLLLLGPTGTGKTELVKSCAEYLYGDKAALHFRRFDLGEFQHPDSVLRLLGACGQPALLGEAVEALNRQGGGILLLDEIEKAHPDLLSLLLSFDEARTTTGDGKTHDLSGCHVMMTSNLGAAEAAQMWHTGYSSIRRKVVHEAEMFLRKETVARFSSVIVMNTLGYEVQEAIASNLLARELLLQSEHCRRWVEVADASVLAFLVSKGFSPDLGARNIRKTIERFVGDALRPYTATVSGDEEELGCGEVGDLWSRGLILRVYGDLLEALPLRRSASLQRLLWPGTNKKHRIKELVT